MHANTETISITKSTGTKNNLKYLQLILTCSVMLLFLSSCNYKLFYVTKGSEGIIKKEVYNVVYSTNIPDGRNAKITYITNEGKKVSLKNVTGKWEKTDQYQSGQEMLFKVTTKLEDKTNDEELSSAITVDDKIFAEHILTGKKVIFRVAFKLP